ncbi:hypothetical protein KUTeg_001005 [Tegillarca granosa]|uniref:HECT domain-containing protein n=1 Tax=Tegillarca granosa TaxID=220873 RepID=A0ABQ9FZK5_TEGGR|nr:hypothetical protein KUTeg_014606 [Tegillarca granosa]KAJ8321447.1 hypothetical protein KUTeg_001005 [Tegillarca granosa]
MNIVLYASTVAGRREGLTLSHLLKFVTGAPEEPLLGFTKQPSILFCEEILPTANTCICRLMLPLEVTTYDRFDLAFLSDYFGYD